MIRIPTLALPLSAAMMAMTTAAGAETRSSDALPTRHGPAPAAHAQGPKHGFPENRGLEHALEEANEHARFRRHDSEG